MHTRTALLGGAAVASVLALGFVPCAEAKAVKHHHRAAGRVETDDDSAALRSEVSALREQVDALKAWRDSQAANQTQSEAQLAQVKAQLAEARAQSQATQAKVDAQIETIPGTVRTEVAAAAPKTDKLYYKGVSVTLGGFAAMETVFRSRNEGADIGSSYSGIPTPNVPSSRANEERFSARQSRFSLLAQGDVSPEIHLAGYGEFDFLGSAVTANSNESNSYTPRVRLLYTSVDWDRSFGGFQMVAGQDWSLATMTTNGITPTVNPPLTIDAQYVPGFVWARQPQIRFTGNLNKTLWFAVSVENPQTTFYTSGKYLPGVSITDTVAGGAEFPSQTGIGYALSLNRVPDVIGKVALDENFAGHALHLEGFGIYRDFYYRLNNSGASGNQDVAGGGVGGGMIFTVIPHLLDVQASGLIGRGIGRYGSGQLPDASFGVDGTIHPIEEADLLLGGALHIGPSLDVYAYGGEEREVSQNYAGINGTATVYNGVGNPNYNNLGCETEGSAVCAGNTHYVDQLTTGFWDRPYVGRFGKFQWGIQYSYTERHVFPGYGPTAGSPGNPAPVARENMILTSIRYYPF